MLRNGRQDVGRRQRLDGRHGRAGRTRVPGRRPDRGGPATSASRAANNIAIRARHGAYVLALNPDTRVTAGALERLLELHGRPARGRDLRAAALEQADGTLDHAARRSFPTPLSALGHFTGIGRRARRTRRARRLPRARRRRAGRSTPSTARSCSCGGAALDEVGLFDEGYWMYMEDLDLCYRFAQAGLGHLVRARRDGACTSRPARAASTARPRLNYAFHYGMLRFYRTHYAASRNPLVNASVYAGIAVKLGLSLATNAVRRRRLARE